MSCPECGFICTDGQALCGACSEKRTSDALRKRVEELEAETKELRKHLGNVLRADEQAIARAVAEEREFIKGLVLNWHASGKPVIVLLDAINARGNGHLVGAR